MIDRFLSAYKQISAASVAALYAGALALFSGRTARNFSPRARVPSSRKAEHRSLEVVTRNVAPAAGWAAGTTWSTSYIVDKAAKAAVVGQAPSRLIGFAISDLAPNNGGSTLVTVDIFVNGVSVFGLSFNTLFVDLQAGLSPVAALASGDVVRVDIKPTSYAGGATNLLGDGRVDLWLETQHVE